MIKRKRHRRGKGMTPRAVEEMLAQRIPIASLGVIDDLGVTIDASLDDLRAEEQRLLEKIERFPNALDVKERLQEVKGEIDRLRFE